MMKLGQAKREHGPNSRKGGAGFFVSRFGCQAPKHGCQALTPWSLAAVSAVGRLQLLVFLQGLARRRETHGHRYFEGFGRMLDSQLDQLTDTLMALELHGDMRSVILRQRKKGR